MIEQPMQKDAYLSEDGLYRYWLTRRWDSGSLLPFIMLNPSTADAVVDDPTIRRCMGFAERENYAGIYVANLFALRATNPKELLKAVNPCGPANDTILRNLAEKTRESGTPIVCAWGTNGKIWKAHEQTVAYLKAYGGELKCLGQTKDGYPKHPLYIKADQPLVPLMIG